MIKIKLTSMKALGMLLVLGGSCALSVIGAAQGNPHWSSPLIALLVMWLIGSLPMGGKRDWFLFAYFVLILGSGALLILTRENVYWTTPLLLGVIANVLNLIPEVEFSR